VPLGRHPVVVVNGCHAANRSYAYIHTCMYVREYAQSASECSRKNRLLYTHLCVASRRVASRREGESLLALLVHNSDRVGAEYC